VERIYLDHAATTVARPEVIAAMVPLLAAGNPSSLHAEGRAAHALLDDARERVARVLGAKAREIVFTGGGSESNNLAILGVARALRDRGRHIISSDFEHHAVLHALDVLRDDGFEITLLPVGSHGVVDPGAFRAAIRPDTILASIMLANNEIGTIQPVAALAAIARERGVTTHTDAVQAPAYLDINVETLGVDLLSIAGHKFSGPKGTGVLYVRTGTPLASLIVGGGQESGLRAGTENLAGIVGLATGLALANAERAEVVQRVATLRDRLEAAICAEIPDVRINGAASPRLANSLSVAFGGSASDLFLINLDLAGIAASAGSACAAGSVEPSHVIAALGLPTHFARGVIRFSLGRVTSGGDIERVIQALPAIARAVR
jgi:cysteine desulfurase